MNQFPKTEPEWLAHEALEAANGNTAIAVDRLRMARDVLLFWQRAAIFDAENLPEEPRRG